MQNSVVVFAGPCAVEDEEQVKQVCSCLKSLGLSWIRGGVFKPRLSPASFQGLGKNGLDILVSNAKSYGLKTITEVLDQDSLDVIYPAVDALQIGTRNMSNYSLLKAIGKKTADSKMPVLFKRGMSAKISEWLTASEYIKLAGNDNIILCERGVRTFEDSTRYTLDISAVPVVHKQSSHPVCVDVSHAAGNSCFVPDLARAAIAAGADALMLEIHPNPMSAKCDGMQQLNLDEFTQLIKELQVIAKSLGKKLV